MRESAPQNKAQMSQGLGSNNVPDEVRDQEVEEELLRLTIHGTLHVVGYRHPQGDERFESEMYQKQEALLENLLKP